VELNKKTASQRFVPAKYEIVNFISAFDSGPLISKQATAKFKSG
jgi:beta-lactamase class D